LESKRRKTTEECKNNSNAGEKASTTLWAERIETKGDNIGPANINQETLKSRYQVSGPVGMKITILVELGKRPTRPT